MCLAPGVFSPHRRALVSLSINYFLPTPHLDFQPHQILLQIWLRLPQLHLKLPGFTLPSTSLGCRNGGTPGKGIRLGEKMHSKTPMGQFIPAVPPPPPLSLSPSILNILQSLDWHDKAGFDAWIRINAVWVSFGIKTRRSVGGWRRAQPRWK